MQALDGSGAPLLKGMPARVEAVASDTLLGADSVEADGIEPRPDDAAGDLCLDMVTRGSGPSTPGSTAPGDAVPAPRFSDVVDPGVVGFPRITAPAYQLGVGHGQCGAGVFVGGRHG
jgi:hypothetical protein